MTAYRDQYASLFRGGRNVHLVAISPDTAEELASWAKDEDFPFLFGSDTDGSSYVALGGNLREGRTSPGLRTVVVVAPDGTVAGLIPDFEEVDPTAYETLAAIIDRVTPEAEETGF